MRLGQHAQRKRFRLRPRCKGARDTFHLRTQTRQVTSHGTEHATSVFNPIQALVVLLVGEALGQMPIAFHATWSVEDELVELAEPEGEAIGLGFDENADARVDEVDVALVFDFEFAGELRIATGQFHEGGHRGLAE